MLAMLPAGWLSPEAPDHRPPANIRGQRQDFMRCPCLYADRAMQELIQGHLHEALHASSACRHESLEGVFL